MHGDVMWCPLMWWAVICCEVMRRNGMRSTSRDAMRCHVMCSHVIACLLWIDAVQWDALSWVYDEMWLVAMSRRVVQVVVSCDEVEEWAGDPYYKVLQVLHSTTRYYSSTRKYYSALQSTTLYYKVLTRTPRHSDTVVPKPKIGMWNQQQKTWPVLMKLNTDTSNSLVWEELQFPNHYILKHTCKKPLRPATENNSNIRNNFFVFELKKAHLFSCKTGQGVTPTPLLPQLFPAFFLTPRTSRFADVICHVAHSSIRGSWGSCFRRWEKVSLPCIFL